MKKKLLFIFLPILTLCLFTGCKSEIKCTTYGLPKETSFCFLVKDPKHSYPPENLKNTVIGDKSEDGWRYISGVGNNADAAKKFGSIKIAVYDREGNILKISPEFPLVIEGRNYYWDDFSYNYETNEVTGNHTEYYGDEMKVAFCNWLIAFVDVLCFITYMVKVCRMKENNYKNYYLYLFLNIPNLIIIIMGGLWTFCDYFQAPDKASNFDRNIKGYLVFIEFVCLVNSLGVIRYRRLKKLVVNKEEKK